MKSEEKEVEIGYIGKGNIQAIIDGANKLDTKTYLSGISTKTVKEEVYKHNKENLEISKVINSKDYNSSDFGIGEC